MSTDQINVAIAELCGWTVVNGVICNTIPDNHGDPMLEPVGNLPDYHGSLDAMAQAEATLTDGEDEHYWVTLHRITDSWAARDWEDWKAVGSATAAQRAEAFLRVKGKWRP